MRRTASRCAAQLTLVSLGLMLLRLLARSPAGRRSACSLPAFWGGRFFSVSLWHCAGHSCAAAPFVSAAGLASTSSRIRAGLGVVHRLLLGWLMELPCRAPMFCSPLSWESPSDSVSRLRVWLFAWPLAKMPRLCPSRKGGIGVREAALVVVARAVGAPASQSSGNGNRLGGRDRHRRSSRGLTAFLCGLPQSRPQGT